MQLVIGNKNYSSWSLRPWLLLKEFSVPFEEIRISLYAGNYQNLIRKYSQAGKVPVLIDGDTLVWDSLAICEYVSEKYLGGNGWPEELSTRAQARSCSAEMHSGFITLRNRMPMNCRATGRSVALTPELQAEIQRIDQLWNELRKRYCHQGHWLFGSFSIADCMFAPVVFRFHTYGIRLGNIAAEYCETALTHPAMQEWARSARDEAEIIEDNEIGRV